MIWVIFLNGLYIHIPFCLKKCNYCDFASYSGLISRSDEYIAALCREMDFYKGEKVNTVYFGGGTPSLLTTVQMERLMTCVSSVFDVDSDSEITVEANPCTVNEEITNTWSRLGINRISLGAQSFLNSELKTLGRLHTTEDTIRAYKLLQSAGFSNISLDLMYALPGQTKESLSTSLEQMLNLAPKHISCYGLKIEEGTPFYTMVSNGEICEKSDDEYADMYDMIRCTLSEHGYKQYELSNFSLEGFESKHNIKYWTMQDYIGIGLGASSLYKGSRFTRTSGFEKYIESFGTSEEYRLSQEERMSEYMILTLRLVDRGAIKSEFFGVFGKTIESVFGDALKKHIANGLIADRGDSYVLSEKAYYISNSVLCDFI